MFGISHVQTLLDSATCLVGSAGPGGCGGGQLSLSLPASLRGGFQLDAVTGRPLAVVGPSGGWYSAALSGGVNRLISARNGSGS
jgi:hypothetical protein